MSEKNFVAYGDAESILTGYANRIKQSPTTFVGTQAQWNALSSSQKAEYELVDITDDSLSPSGHVDWESFGELGAVNLFDFTINSTVAKGITFVQNSDGTVTVSGSNTQGSGVGILTKVQMLKKGTYILSGCPSITNGVLSLQLSDEPTSIGLIAEAKNGQEVTFTLASDTNVKIQYYANAIASITGSVTIKPMLRLATDSDSTYQPYAMTNKELTKQVAPIDDMNNILGAKNLLPNNATTQVLNGITFTVNADGSITANGTANADTWLWLRSYAQGGLYLPTGRYIINGSVSEASDAYNWSVYVVIAGESTNLATDWGHDANGVEFENTSTSNRLISAIWIKSGAVLNNLLFKPMIRPASIKDATYIPYSKTNSELTVELSNFATYVTDKVLDSDFASDIGATNSRTIVFNNLVKRPTQVAYIPEHNQWVTQAVQSININNNSVTVTVMAYGFISTNYARVGGRLVYR